MAVYTPPEELNHTATVETTDRGAVVVPEDEAPHGGIFDGLKEDAIQEPDHILDSGKKVEDEKAVEETPAEETPVVETVEETPVAEKPEPPAGVSPVMRELALNGGIPSSLVDFCYDDTQIQELLDLTRASAESRADTENEEELTAKLMIPDDEFDASDPVHAQQKHLVEVFNKAMKQMREGVDESLASSRNIVADREQDFRNSMFLAYDKALDTLDQEIIGPPGSDQRRETWSLYSALLAANPEKDHTQLAIQAARATHDRLVTTSAVKAQQENLDKQKTKTLGGGASPAPIETPKEPMNEFVDFLRSLPSDN